MIKIFYKLNEGGPFFTYPMVIILLIIIALFILEMLKKDNSEKTIKLLKSISWFTLVWGYLGHTIGLITAFDAIQAAGDISPSMMAGGLKIALLNPVFSASVFLIARVLIIILIAKEKKD